MSRRPLVSVVMPAYNAEQYIASAIESILSQNFKKFELVIIDDRSTDDTYSIAKGYQESDPRIRLYRNRNNIKIGRTLNKGIKLAKTNLVARMDADDLSMKDRLELQYEYLLRKPNVAIVGGYMEVIDEEGEKKYLRKYPARSEELKSVMFRYSPFAHPTVMYRKDIIQKFNGYTLDLHPCEDIDLWFKVGTEHDFGCIQKPLLKYRMYSESSSHKKLTSIEMLTFKIRINAIKKYGYRPTIHDIVYNLLQFFTIWFIPAKTRITLYNFLRSRGLI